MKKCNSILFNRHNNRASVLRSHESSVKVAASSLSNTVKFSGSDRVYMHYVHSATLKVKTDVRKKVSLSKKLLALFQTGLTQKVGTVADKKTYSISLKYQFTREEA